MSRATIELTETARLAGPILTQFERPLTCSQDDSLQGIPFERSRDPRTVLLRLVGGDRDVTPADWF